MPVRLAPRPVFLAGREGLLAELDARLAGGAGPRLVALCGLGGAGKTSVAVEYAHRHLAEVGVCWQFPAEDPAVLAAEFAVLAAQLGARELVDARDPVASVHAVLARPRAGWLLVFDNAVDRASVERFVPPAGNGRVLVTTQSQHWLPGQALDVPVLDTDVAADFLVNRTGDADRAAALELAGRWAGCRWRWSRPPRTCRLPGPPWPGTWRCSGTGRRTCWPGARPPGIRRTWPPRWAWPCPGWQARLRRGGAAAAAGVPGSRAGPAGPAARRRAGRGPARPEVAAGIGPLLGDPVAAGDAITALRRYSLVTPAGDGLVLVHRLVQAVTRAQLPAEEAAQWQQAAAALVEAAVPADPKVPAAWPACAVLLPHARAVLDLTSDGMWRIALYLGQSGSYPAARDLFRLIADARTAMTPTAPSTPTP